MVRRQEPRRGEGRDGSLNKDALDYVIFAPTGFFLSYRRGARTCRACEGPDALRLGRVEDGLTAQ